MIREAKEELGVDIFEEDIEKEFQDTLRYNFEDKGIHFIDGN